MKKKIAAIKEYLKYFPNESGAKNNLLFCEYVKEFGIELNKGYYPTMQYGYFVINSQIKIGKEYYLTNSTTQYKQNGVDSLVIWAEPCGRLAFVSDRYWWDIENEWRDFMNVLKSYEPLDYDELNNNYIYDIEHGKKLIQDYDKIVKDFMDKVNKKIKEVEIANKKKELERLQKELAGV